MESELPPLLKQLFTWFPFLFIGMWVLVCFILSKMGWSNLADNYRSDNEFIGTRVGIISAAINRINYKNALVLKYNEEGIYLKSVIIFRAFHAPILIPWRDIIEVRDRKSFFVTFKELLIGSPLVATIRLSKSTFSAIEKELTKHTVRR